MDVLNNNHLNNHRSHSDGRQVFVAHLLEHICLNSRQICYIDFGFSENGSGLRNTKRLHNSLRIHILVYFNCVWLNKSVCLAVCACADICVADVHALNLYNAIRASACTLGLHKPPETDCLISLVARNWPSWGMEEADNFVSPSNVSPR